MTRKQLILVAEAADLAERLGKATETSTREALQKQIVDVHVRLKEAMDEDPAKEMDPMKAKEMDPMKAKEMDPMKYKEMGDDAYKAKEMDDGAMGMIRKLVPKMTDESDDDYAGRVSKVQAACKEMEKPRAEGGMESLRESVSVDSFRKEYPRLFEAVVGRIRNHDDRGEKDFKALRAELQESQVKVQVYEDQKLATALLAESGLPKRVLDVSDLIGQTREEMIRTIDKTKAILESVGANNTVVVPVFGGGGGPGGSAGAGSAEIKLRESAKAFVKKAGE